MKINGKDVVIGDEFQVTFKDKKTGEILITIDDLNNATDEEKLLVMESLKHAVLDINNVKIELAD